MNYSEYIRTRRLVLGLSQKELAEKMGLSPISGQNSVYRWEACLRSPDKKYVRKLSEILDLPTECLLP